MRIFRIVGAILGLGLSSLAGANCPQTVMHETLAPRGPAAETFTVPFALIDNRIFVHVCLNDQGPFNVIFDTGADAVITPQTAQALRLKPAAGEDVTGVGANKVKSGTATIAKSSLGLAVLPAHDYQVFPLDGSREVFGNTPVDGVIGEPLFDRYAVTIDYTTRQLTFVSNERFHYAGRGVSVPFSRLDEIPTIKGTLDGVAGEFDVDTGARSSLILFAPFIERYSLRQKYSATIEGIAGWGVGGPVRSQLARAGSFTVGGIAIKGPIIRLTTQKAGLTATLDKAGLIGPDILRQFRVTFDYAHRRMILEKGPLFGTLDSYDKTGTWLGQDGDYFKVLDVMSGGPASAAGIKTGDLVTSVGDIPTRELSLPEVRRTFKDMPAGSSITMTIRDPTGDRVVRLILRDLV